MNNLLEFLKKHKPYVLLICILIFILPLIIVHILYSIDIRCEWLKAKWSAGELLSYIAGFEAFIGTVSLGFLSLYQNHQLQSQYEESKKPLLSMNLINDNNFIYLVIENNGETEATNININIFEIQGNGNNNILCLDDLFNAPFQLFPKEMVKGRVAIFRSTLSDQFFPKIKLMVSYTHSNYNKKEEYERTVLLNNRSL